MDVNGGREGNHEGFAMAASRAPLDETAYDPMGLIHEAVLAEKERPRPELKRRRIRANGFKGRPDLKVEQILAWADAHHESTGSWPHQGSGAVVGMSSRHTWNALNEALRHGRRGLAGGSTLARLLSECRGVYNPKGRPPLRVDAIVRWADRYKSVYGRFPDSSSGPVAGHPHETWCRVNSALVEGLRGLAGGSSLLKLLHEKRGAKHKHVGRGLSEQLVLDYADAYHDRTGKWPGSTSGLIDGVPGETWNGIDGALSAGLRGLPGGSSVARLLAEHRGAYNKKGRPPLTEELILEAVDRYYDTNGRYPTRASGPIDGRPHETWSSVNSALVDGIRGLPRKSSLARLIREGRVGL